MRSRLPMPWGSRARAHECLRRPQPGLGTPRPHRFGPECPDLLPRLVGSPSCFVKGSFEIGLQGRDARPQIR